MGNVTFKDVRKRYGEVEVLHGIDFKIEEGEFCILVGPSGCGKSTLLRMLAGLEEISSGEILINDKVVNELAPKKRDIAMVFQSYALYPHMTVAQNMGFSLRLAGVAKPEIAKRVSEAAGIIGLTDYLERQPKALSGGQRQRVAMGRAIVRDPAVFLFDEPLSNLDAKLRVQMRAEVKGLQKRLGTTTVYVTHDQVEAMTMADRIVVMYGGYVQQHGAPLELYDNPANMFVAGFIGSPSMNFLDVVLTDDGLRLANGQIVPLTAPLSGDRTAGRKLVLGVRPEHITQSPGGVPTTIEVVEPLGSETLIQTSLEGKTMTILLKERIDATSGDTFMLAMDDAPQFLFDPETEKRV